MMQDPKYQAAFEQVKEVIDTLKSRMNERLHELETRIETIDEELVALGPNAIGTLDHDRLIKSRDDILKTAGPAGLSLNGHTADGRSDV